MIFIDWAGKLRPNVNSSKKLALLYVLYTESISISTNEDDVFEISYVGYKKLKNPN